MQAMEILLMKSRRRLLPLKTALKVRANDDVHNANSHLSSMHYIFRSKVNFNRNIQFLNMSINAINQYTQKPRLH